MELGPWVLDRVLMKVPHATLGKSFDPQEAGKAIRAGTVSGE